MSAAGAGAELKERVRDNSDMKLKKEAWRQLAVKPLFVEYGNL